MHYFLSLIKNHTAMPKRVKQVISDDIQAQMKLIGNQIMSLRQKIDPNYQDFAKDRGINYMTLWRVQNGMDVQLSTFLKILKTLDVTPADFFQNISQSNSGKDF